MVNLFPRMKLVKKYAEFWQPFLYNALVLHQVSTAGASKVGGHLCAWDVPFMSSCLENTTQLGHMLSLEQ